MFFFSAAISRAAWAVGVGFCCCCSARIVVPSSSHPAHLHCCRRPPDGRRRWRQARAGCGGRKRRQAHPHALIGAAPTPLSVSPVRSRSPPAAKPAFRAAPTLLFVRKSLFHHYPSESATYNLGSASAFVRAGPAPSARPPGACAGPCPTTGKVVAGQPSPCKSKGALSKERPAPAAPRTRSAADTIGTAAHRTTRKALPHHTVHPPPPGFSNSTLRGKASRGIE